MKKQTVHNCVDSGSKYCPCHLAYSGDCIRCGMLNGKNCCDCIWQGVCIYNEVQKSKNERLDLGQRKEYLCKILEKKELDINTYLLKIEIPKQIAIELSSPGTYILMKSKDKDKDIFNAPISVMDVDLEANILEVIIKTVGVKTKTIINHEEVYVKAPYFNGIFGIKDIKTTENSNCLVVLNGLSQVNAIKVIKRLIENRNKVDVYINNQGVILQEIVDKILKLGATLYYSDLEKDPEFISDYIFRNDIKLVYSAGSNRFSKTIMEMTDKVDPSIKLAISNNNLICCGEGICGACSISINGETVKTCKSQVDSRVFLKSL